MGGRERGGGGGERVTCSIDWRLCAIVSLVPCGSGGGGGFTAGSVDACPDRVGSPPFPIRAWAVLAFGAGLGGGAEVVGAAAGLLVAGDLPAPVAP